MILMIDNYDSFTYNLVQYIGELGIEVKVARNDELTIDVIQAINPQIIVVSPGPCTPNEAGISLEVISHFAGKIPILGVCLGHQAIGQAFGGKVIRADRLMHGKVSPVFHNSEGVNADMPNPFRATRYHSLLVERESLPECLEITAWTEEGEIMGLRHKKYAVEGVQYHPESIMTEEGKKIIRNFVETYSLTAKESR
ncbi:aminodeoxychorismate/anthranilate synthase component II [Psychrobacillus psychrodurans]|uniref:aminodeoxychorismate/anthranilate synthase component II n=1 Tax=Psychrobacillus psychrodurans TaxID=126157 RepID=UPI0008EB5E97|nr:aminodeoxychorismate/anthranilate synthase component II [Psychrobacillus psychrodurans]MCZ8542096.1 aminodeoxychorismate/anthranilate synthase component II [Psychrobacillus psychrodurans]SFN16497.1 para-aminobenzoate synthetase component 2 [Psychrobacillus psychrodurans]